ncbi:MAG: hypothetical protein ACLS2V_11700 [Clostridium paraputrificum]
MKTILKISTDNHASLLETKDSIYDAITKDLGSCLDNVKTEKLGKRYYMVVSDDGYARNLPVNYIGSYLYNTDENIHFIVGDIYIVKDINSSYEGLNDEDIKYLFKEVLPG